MFKLKKNSLINNVHSQESLEYHYLKNKFYLLEGFFSLLHHKSTFSEQSLVNLHLILIIHPYIDLLN
ncbi:unnamed protein product [Paramecium sonneborni]|uniref:Uncharacterized protein n=1 Tax=Paramecium sonneborni TaxID=65129 RepID=A0A8S1MG73_9CILI|nr:unnamed protein product [Paramecium sonneborni]